MRFWVRLSRTIFRLAALPLLNKIRPKSIESVLKNSIGLLNDDTTAEIRQFISEKQNLNGGFVDRAGKSDLYYSLFGYLLAESYSCNYNISELRKFVKSEVSKNISGVHLYCGAILYSRLFGYDEVTQSLNKKIIRELNHLRIEDTSTLQHSEYSSFLGFLALYYLEDFIALKTLIRKNKKNSIPTNGSSTAQPCPVVAANTVLESLSGKNNLLSEKRLLSFYSSKGGFFAVSKAPERDLLSTGVALYALNFIGSDIRLIKPQCLSFVDDLYDNGGFRATVDDFESDVEYTFYGLLALGSLK